MWNWLLCTEARSGQRRAIPHGGDQRRMDQRENRNRETPYHYRGDYRIHGDGSGKAGACGRRDFSGAGGAYSYGYHIIECDSSLRCL